MIDFICYNYKMKTYQLILMEKQNRNAPQNSSMCVGVRVCVFIYIAYTQLYAETCPPVI